MGDALKFIGRVAGGILDVIGAVVKGIKAAVEFAISGINVLIKAYNAIPFLPNVNTISAPTVSSAPSVSKPSTASVPVPQVPATNATSTPKISSSAASSPSASVAKVVTPLNSAGVGNFNAGSFRQAEERGNTVNITVNGAVDPVGTARQIATIINTEASTAGSFSNLGVSRFATRAE